MLKMIKTLITEMNILFVFIVRAWPVSPIGQKLRQWYWSRKVAGRKPVFQRMSNITDHQLATIGDNISVGEYVVIDPNNSKGIYIGSNVFLAIRTYIRGANHQFSSLERLIKDQGHRADSIQYQGREYSIVIEDDVWIGANAIILSGSMIGTGCVIGAGCIIDSEIPPYSIVQGNDASRIVRKRENRV